MMSHDAEKSLISWESVNKQINNYLMFNDPCDICWEGMEQIWVCLECQNVG